MPKYVISVKTSDRKNAGTDANVLILMRDIKGNVSPDIKLDKTFRNDFEQGNLDGFQISVEDKLSEITEIEFWRDDWGIGDDWHLECISVQDCELKKILYFPFHHWVSPNRRYLIEAYDCSLPQDAKRSRKRAEAVRERSCLYEYTQLYPGFPLQVKEVPKEDEISESTFDFASRLDLHARKCGVQLLNAVSESFTDLDEPKQIVGRLGYYSIPENLDDWREDEFFGQQKLNGCNPKLIRLCKDKLPDNFALDSETLEEYLEGKSLVAAIAEKKIFYIDLTCLQGVKPTKGLFLCSPICCFYLNSKQKLLPIAIQLHQEHGQDHPVFYPSDDPGLWLLVKMWFNVSEASYHQAITHIGGTRLLMEGFCLSMNRHLSISHPLYKLLAPHMFSLLAANQEISNLMETGGMFDVYYNLGKSGVQKLISKLFENVDISEREFMNDLVARGVDDENTLPDYHYRDDGLLLYNAIGTYVKKMVFYFYKTSEHIMNDMELQSWGTEMAAPRMNGLGLSGVPGNGCFRSHKHLVILLRFIIFTNCVEHAAVKYSIYNQYCHTPSFPSKLLGAPPRSKDHSFTDEEIAARLCSKSEMIKGLVMNGIMSERTGRVLGDYEVDYHFLPQAVKYKDEFCTELKTISKTIRSRNSKREYRYTTLDPLNISNSINS